MRLVLKNLFKICINNDFINLTFNCYFKVNLFLSMNYMVNITKINYIKINQYVIYHLILIKNVKICVFFRFYYRNIFNYK